MWGSGPEESASPKACSHKQSDGEAEVGRAGTGGAPPAGLGVSVGVITAVSSAAGDVGIRQFEAFSHMEALAPGGRCTASYRVARVPQPVSACGLQTLVHGASAGGEGGLLGGTAVGAIPLTAVALEAIQRQLFKLRDWAPIAFGGVAASQEVEGVVVVKAGGAWAAGEVATASGVALISGAPCRVLVGHHLQALFTRVAALEALVPAPLTAQVRGSTGNTFEVAASGEGGRPARVGPVAQIKLTHGLCQRDDLHAYPIAHGPIGLLGMGTVCLHHLQLFPFLPYAQDRGPAEILAGRALLHLAMPGPLTPHAPQAPGGWNAGLNQQQQQQRRRQHSRDAHGRQRLAYVASLHF